MIQKESFTNVKIIQSVSIQLTYYVLVYKKEFPFDEKTDFHVINHCTAKQVVKSKVSQATMFNFTNFSVKSNANEVAGFILTKFAVKSNANQGAVFNYTNLFVKSNANEVTGFILTKFAVKSNANYRVSNTDTDIE